MEKESFYITTTIPYVNAEPHIGFALEVVEADAIARYKRLMGYDVFYNAGTDEHGQKILEKAKEEGEDIQVYVDRNAELVRKLKGLLNLSYDNFIRTTDEHHKRAAQELWKLCDKNGDIYKKKYKGLYCVGCEKFLSERDLENGRCPIHPNQEPIELEEENYFFKLSNYQEMLEEYLKKPGVVVPPHRLREAQQFVENGLEDFSISRERAKLPWGVPVPGDDAQIMYVWFDALTNYISTLGWPEDAEGKYKKFWEEGFTLQMAGKDQIRFQSIMWPAMLASAGLKAPDQVFYHGFINSGGQRMSKSLGNVIKPGELVEKYGTDATRYLLLRHVHPTEDTDVTWERLDEWYTADLVNGIGNLVARVMKMAESYFAEPYKIKYESSLNIPTSKDLEIDTLIQKYLEKYEFDKAINVIWEKIGDLDVYIQLSKPFNVYKRDRKEAQNIVKKLVYDLIALSNTLKPFMPETAEMIKEAIRTNRKPENLFARLEE